MGTAFRRGVRPRPRGAACHAGVGQAVRGDRGRGRIHPSRLHAGGNDRARLLTRRAAPASARRSDGADPCAGPVPRRRPRCLGSGPRCPDPGPARGGVPGHAGLRRAEDGGPARVVSRRTRCLVRRPRRRPSRSGLRNRGHRRPGPLPVSRHARRLPPARYLLAAHRRRRSPRRRASRGPAAGHLR